MREQVPTFKYLWYLGLTIWGGLAPTNVAEVSTLTWTNLLIAALLESFVLRAVCTAQMRGLECVPWFLLPLCLKRLPWENSYKSELWTIEWVQADLCEHGEPKLALKVLGLSSSSIILYHISSSFLSDVTILMFWYLSREWIGEWGKRESFDLNRKIEWSQEPSIWKSDTSL